MQYHVKHTVTMPVGTITESGIKEINIFIASQRIYTPNWKALNPNEDRRFVPPLPEWWDYRWVITDKGEYVGTFTKRVSKYYKKEYGLKSPNNFISELGNIARRHSNDISRFVIDFDDRLDWDAGEFGDNHSCLWGDNVEGRYIMQDNGVRAVRFYDDQGDGYGRAWLYQINPDLWIVWNGYGIQGSTIAIARVLSQFWSVPYKKVSLRNQGKSDGLVWINGGSGYLLGSESLLDRYTNIDLEFDTPIHCTECECTLHEDFVYYTPDGDVVCEDCFYERATFCACCREEHWYDDVYYISHDIEYVCDYCLDRNYTQCDNCEEHYNNESITKTGKRYLCPNCIKK